MSVSRNEREIWAEVRGGIQETLHLRQTFQPSIL